MVFLYKTEEKYKIELDLIDKEMGVPVPGNVFSIHAFSNGLMPKPSEGFFYYIDCIGQELEPWYTERLNSADGSATNEDVEIYKQQFNNIQ